MNSLFQEYDLVAGSGYFDAGYYLAHNPDVAKLGIDPLLHYLEQGGGEGRNPHPDFDTKFYLEQCARLDEQPDNPLVHFLTIGASRGLAPSHKKAPAAGHAETPKPTSIAANLDELSAVAIQNGQCLIRGRGWAVSPSEIQKIAIEVDGSHRGFATYGLIRSDVAGQFPQLPNSDLSGLSFEVQVAHAGQAELAVALVITAATGEVEKLAQRVAVKPAGPPGRDVPPVPSGDAAAATAEPADFEFDETWYLSQYPDVARTLGPDSWLTGRDHYILHGRNEGRLPVPPADGEFHGFPQSLDGLDPDIAAVRSEAFAHKGAGFLAPTTLRVTPPFSLKIALIGSCLMREWDLQSVTNEISGLDLYLVNFLSTLPEKSQAEIAEYDFAVVQVPLRSVVEDFSLSGLRYDDLEGHQRAFERSCDRLEQHLINWLYWNRKHGLLTFVCNFMVPQANPMGRLLPRYDLRNFQFFVEQLNARLENIVRSQSNVYLFDLDRLSASVGRRYTQDDVIEFLGHNTFLGYGGPILNRIEPIAAVTEYYEPDWVHTIRPVLWAELTAMYRTIQQVDAVKLVVVDLDDTLWQGVAGDMAEIDPAEMTEGWPLGFAEALMYLRKRGILLAIISKNEDRRIREIFPQVWGRNLLLEHFAAVSVSWRPKPDSMAELLATMNLLPRNVVFIDDNPAERAAMQAAFPDMRILGRHPRWLRRELMWSAETDVAAVTEESGRRTEMVQRQFEREDKRKSLSREDFLASAAPSVEILEVTGAGHPRFARIVELINKTNQFNTTGKRWKAEELLALIAAGGRIFGFTAADSFTNYGLVGIVLTEGSRIVQWVMSCRVVGYEIERAVMAHLLPILRAAAPGPLSGKLIETDANFPARGLFSACGFVQDGEDWHLPADAVFPAPAHVAVAMHVQAVSATGSPPAGSRRKGAGAPRSSKKGAQSHDKAH